MYIGQTESVPMETWIYNATKCAMEKTEVVYNPALLKIFDEILVNAADNRQRDSRMTKIEIIVHRSEENELQVSVLNDGKGIPLEVHKTEGIYVPELIFGHLLTGSNFNDKENRLTGGSHGYGAKLTNIFSKQFTVEAMDSKRGVLYKQRWSNNMSKVEAPEVTTLEMGNSTNYTKITFQPDLKRFGINLDATTLADIAVRDRVIDQVVQMFQRRAMDVAACVAPTEVSFSYTNNCSPEGELQGSTQDKQAGSIPIIRSFKDYAQLFAPPAAPFMEASEDSESEGSCGEDNLHESDIVPKSSDIVYSNVNPRWEVAVGMSDTGTFENMSFVNNVWTVRGGTHVNMVTAQVVKAVEAALARKGVTSASPAAIRNKLLVLVNCKIENPAFDGQTKDSLNSKPSTFGSTCKLSEQFLKEIIKKSGIVESLLDDLALKEHNKALRAIKGGRKQLLEVPKLEDAHDAGGPGALDCTLILTEGDSAKALAVAGLEVVGREKFGVMPLRGKVINVRSATRSQSLKNSEFINLCKALGLSFGDTYENGLQDAGLRYGKVLIMCDQDTDGSHIKGLVINLFHHFWPALLKHDGFLQQFITPIVKARSSRGKGKGRESLSFYSIPEFKQWQESQQSAFSSETHNTGDDNSEEGVNDSGGSGEKRAQERYTIKYYKGLGTNTSAEGREYFQALDMHRKAFTSLTPPDGDAIDLAFNKERSGNRKEWLNTQHDVHSFLDPHAQSVTYQDFIHKELIHFSYADIHRSIPSVIDGLKPSQRKVLYGCLKKKLLKEEAKVVQIAGYIAEHTAYHHGETSLHNTIINMAQDFVGSNNVPLLVASGQFGTRAQGGKDFASPRYVFTKLSPITRLLFPEEDDSFLQYEEEDGLSVEPNFYMPVIPTLLLNGSQGIGTGWSTFVPSFHLPQIVDQVRHRIAGTHPGAPLIPHVAGFRGTIAPTATPAADTNQGNRVADFRYSGIISRHGETQLVISELPPGVWTDNYKAFLSGMVERGEIKEFKEFHSADKVHFEITASKTALRQIPDRDLLKRFKLHSSMSLCNMHAFDRFGKICKYSTPDQIIDAHFEVRREGYVTRKAALERKFAAEELKSRNKSRFIASILNDEIQLLSRGGKAGSTAAGAGQGGLGPGSLSESTIVAELRRRGFADEQEIQHMQEGQHAGASTAAAITTSTAGSSSSATSAGAAGGFSYLLDMPIYSLTEERSLQLQQRAVEAGEKLRQITTKSVDDLWLADLDTLSSAFENSQK